MMGPSEMAATPASTVSSQADGEADEKETSPDAPVPADRRGPSAEDWERHKRTIIGMYGTMKLKEIRERMSTQYAFHAT